MTPTIVLRPARPEEARDVRRLAYLDSQRPLKGDILVAEVGGALVAATSLRDGRLVADPFTYTEDFVELLREHALGMRTARVAPRRRSRRPQLGYAA